MLQVSEPIQKAYRFRHIACALDATEHLLAASLKEGPEFRENIGQAFKLLALCAWAGAQYVWDQGYSSCPSCRSHSASAARAPSCSLPIFPPLPL